jgi:uroporphyrinogen-III synthase
MCPEPRRELAGRRVLVTRAPEQSGELGALLQARGAEAILCPLLRSEPAAVPGDLPDLAAYDWLVLTSPAAVRHLGDLLAAAGSRTVLPPRLLLAVVGPGTEDAVRADLRRPVALRPREATGAGLAAAFRERGLPPRSRVLRVRGDLAADEVETALQELGADVTPWTIYRTVAAPPPAPIVALLGRGGLDAVTFASGSAVAAFAAGFPDPGHGENLLAACLGPVTARAAADRGWRRIVTAAEPTAAGLVEALVRALGPSPAEA